MSASTTHSAAGTASALNVRVFGPPDGRPVLALHGVSGHALRFTDMAARLPELRLFAVDLRGHGYSPWTPPWNLEQHVADVLTVLDAHGLGRVPVIGHSFGGAVAVHLSRTAPHRVERLVLIDPAIGVDPDRMLAMTTEACVLETYPDPDAARAERARAWAGVADDLVGAEIEHHLYEEDGHWRFRYATPALVAALAEVARPAITPPPDVPTLLLPAPKADFVVPAWVERLRAELGERLVVEEMDTGHQVHLERPAETAAAIRAFLG